MSQSKTLSKDDKYLKVFGDVIADTEVDKRIATEHFAQAFLDREDDPNAYTVDDGKAFMRGELLGQIKRNLVMIESQANGYTNEEARHLADAVMDCKDAYYRTGDVDAFSKVHSEKYSDLSENDIKMWDFAAEDYIERCFNEGVSLDLQSNFKKMDPTMKLAIGVSTIDEYQKETGNTVDMTGAVYVPKYTDTVGSYHDMKVDEALWRGEEPPASMQEKVDSVKEKASEKWDATKEKASEKADVFKDSAADKFSVIKEKLSEYMDQIRLKVDIWKDAHPELVEKAKALFSHEKQDESFDRSAATTELLSNISSQDSSKSVQQEV